MTVPWGDILIETLGDFFHFAAAVVMYLSIHRRRCVYLRA